MCQTRAPRFPPSKALGKDTHPEAVPKGPGAMPTAAQNDMSWRTATVKDVVKQVAAVAAEFCRLDRFRRRDARDLPALASAILEGLGSIMAGGKKSEDFLS